MKLCYICGSSGKLTKDHVPPKNLFPDPKPSDLITLSCCDKCNNGFAMDDEAFRIFVASVINRSAAGDRAWKEGVVASSFARSPKLRGNVAKSLVPVSIETPEGRVELTGLTFPQERGDRYLTRLTKGLLSHFYPQVSHSDAVFEINQLLITQEIHDDVLSRLAYDERGEQVFRFWRGFSDDEGQINSLWVFVFYDALAFTVDVTGLSIRVDAAVTE